MTMRANNEAMRATLYAAAALLDLERHAATEEERTESGERLALMIPILKTWCTDLGVEMASLGVQVHGGMGYVEETGAAQFLRDARIAPIYEGTNGIQSLDLVTRKLPMRGGEVVTEYITEMEAIAQRLGEIDGMTIAAQELEKALSVLGDVSAHVGAEAGSRRVRRRHGRRNTAHTDVGNRRRRCSSRSRCDCGGRSTWVRTTPMTGFSRRNWRQPGSTASRSSRRRPDWRRRSSHRQTCSSHWTTNN